MLLVLRVVVGDDVARGRVVVGRLEAQAELVHARQVVDAVGRAEAQRLPAVLPRAARARPAVEHHEFFTRLEAEAAQVEGDRETCLARTDDHAGGGQIGRAHPE